MIVLSGSGLSAESGLPTFRGEGGLYDGVPAEALLSAEGYARRPVAVEGWIERLRAAAAAAQPNHAHVTLADYQRRHPDTALLTQNVDTLLERAGASDVVHLHGRLDRLRCLGHAHPLPLPTGSRADAPERCPRCGSRLRSDVVLFGEAAPAYATLWTTLRRAGPTDALVVIGTQGGVLPIAEIVRDFPGRTVLNTLHASDWIDDAAFDRVFREPATRAVDGIVAALEAWRAA